jgi:hypothetical protein
VVLAQILLEVHAVGVGKNYRWKPDTTEHGAVAIGEEMRALLEYMV